MPFHEFKVGGSGSDLAVGNTLKIKHFQAEKLNYIQVKQCKINAVAV